MPETSRDHNRDGSSSSTNANGVASSSRLCWICQGTTSSADGDDTEEYVSWSSSAAPPSAGRRWADDEMLVDCVCRCRGSLGAVHQRCIDQWVLHQGKTHCSSCESVYHSVTAVPRHVLVRSSELSRPIDHDVPPSLFSLMSWLLRWLSSPLLLLLTRGDRRRSSAELAQQQLLLGSMQSSSASSDVELHASEHLLALLLPHTLVGKLWYVFHQLIRPWLRRCVWFLLLFVWHNVALPMFYGAAYYSHGHRLDEMLVVWGAAASFGSSNSTRGVDGPGEVVDTAVPSRVSDRLMLQCNAFLVGIVLTIVFRFTCSGWKHWKTFIGAGSETLGTRNARVPREEVDGAQNMSDAMPAQQPPPPPPRMQRDGPSANDIGGDTSNFTIVEFLQNLLSDAMFRCCGWNGQWAPFLRQEVSEARIVLPLAWVLGLHGSLVTASVVAVVASVVLRVYHPLKEVRRPTARLEETVARRAEATPLDSLVWFVTYLCDMLAFSVLLPTLGGYVLHYSLGRRLVQLPDRVAHAVDWFVGLSSSIEVASATSSALTTTTTAAPAEAMLALSCRAVDLISNATFHVSASIASVSLQGFVSSAVSVVSLSFVSLPPLVSSWSPFSWEYHEELPWFSDILLHWLVGTMCLMTLLRYESTVVVPLFQPGVDLFFIRSIDVSDESLGDREDDFAWKFILSQVFDADPLRVLIDYVRVGLLESLALLGFVCFPVQGAFALAASWYGEGATPAQLTPLLLSHLWDDTALRAPRWSLPFSWIFGSSSSGSLTLFGSRTVAAAAEVVVGSVTAAGGAFSPADATTISELSPIAASQGATAAAIINNGAGEGAGGAPAVFSWWSLILNVVAFGTVVSCLMNYPIQRYQLTCLLPAARWLARLVRLEDFLFDPSRLEMVDNFLAMPVLDDSGDVELVMPAVPDERRFVRRERWYSDETRPKLLRLRLAAFSFGFYVVSTVCWWGMPTLVAAAILPFCATTLEFIRYSLLLTCFIVHPRLFLISHLRFLAVVAALSLAWLFQLIQVLSSWYAMIGLDLLVLHTFEYKHYAVRRVARMPPETVSTTERGGEDSAADAWVVGEDIK